MTINGSQSKKSYDSPIREREKKKKLSIQVVVKEKPTRT
jgi:hypothetical protein